MAGVLDVCSVCWAGSRGLCTASLRCAGQDRGFTGLPVLKVGRPVRATESRACSCFAASAVPGKVLQNSRAHMLRSDMFTLAGSIFCMFKPVQGTAGTKD